MRPHRILRKRLLVHRNKKRTQRQLQQKHRKFYLKESNIFETIKV